MAGPVQPLSVVDNSDCSPNGLTVRETRRILAFQGTLPSSYFQQRGFVWPFMSSCSCSRSASFLWRFFGVFAGPIFSLPTHQQGGNASLCTVCSSHTPHLTAPPVVSPLLAPQV